MVKDVDVADLPGEISAAAFNFLTLADAMLAGPLPVAGIGEQTVSEVDALQKSGWRLALEISADESDRTVVVLVAISPSGSHRRPIRVLRKWGNAQ